MHTRKDRGTTTAIPDGSQRPIALRARCGSRDTIEFPGPRGIPQSGIPDRDVGVPPLNVSVLTIELSAVSPAHRFSSIYGDGLCSRAVRLISRGNRPCAFSQARRSVSNRTSRHSLLILKSGDLDGMHPARPRDGPAMRAHRPCTYRAVPSSTVTGCPST